MKTRTILKFSKTAWVVGLCLCLVSTLTNPRAASAADTQLQQLVYEVYAGGIHAVQMTLDFDMRKSGRYDMVMYAKTRGFLGSVAPWEGTFESHGWVLKGNKFQPEKHQSTASWREEVDIKEYLYNKDGTFKTLLVTDEYSKRKPHEIDPEVTNGTIDALTATLQVLHDYNENGRCEGSSEVFDGKRRFKQVFNHEKNITLEASKYNIYGGPAAECMVEVIPVSGEWSKKPRGWLSIQEQGRERGTMPTVWIAKLTEDGPAVPIKVRVKTAYGTLFMHLAEYKNADTILVAEKRVTEDGE